jgi:hypothetical protein
VVITSPEGRTLQLDLAPQQTASSASMGQVRTWLAGARFTIQEEAEGPWHEEGYAYHHMLPSVEVPPG